MEAGKRNDRLERVLTLLSRIGDGAQLDANGLAEEFEVSRRTIFRDLNMLRRVGVNIRIDCPSEGYSIETSNHLLGKVSQEDLLELLRHASCSVLPRSRAQQRTLDRTIRRIADQLPNDYKLVLENQNASRQIPCLADAHRQAFDRLVLAIARQRSVEIFLDPCTTYGTQLIELIPLRIEYATGAWRIAGVSATDHCKVIVHLDAIEMIQPVFSAAMPRLAKRLTSWSKPDFVIAKMADSCGSS